MTSTLDREQPPEAKGPKPIVEAQRPVGAQIGVYTFLLVPTVAILVAVPFTWGWGLSWLDIILGVAFYFVGLLGVTAGFHRYFTHGSYKANRGLRATLAVMGMLAMQGPVVYWVADHRRHHAFSDREGDPHSPWLFGTSPAAIARGFWHAHMGWIFDRDKTNQQRFAPDLLADPLISRLSKLFWLWTLVTLLAPAILGGLISWSWWGAVTAFFWAGLVRVAILHHVTWSTNSICHMLGDRPFRSKDKSANFWPLAILSGGESWHNLHHADPTCARHGVKRGQIDISARLIWCFEKFGWAKNVRWPTSTRLARLTKAEA